MVKHTEGAAGGAEYTACGLAFDAYDSGDHSDPIEFAKSGEIVTCADCREAIDHFRKYIKYRVP